MPRLRLRSLAQPCSFVIGIKDGQALASGGSIQVILPFHSSNSAQLALQAVPNPVFAGPNRQRAGHPPQPNEKTDCHALRTRDGKAKRHQ